MQAEHRAKAELLNELSALRKRLSKLEQVQQTLQQSEEKWRSLVDNAPDIIVVVDRDGTVSYINHTVSGIPPEEVVGKTVYDYVTTGHRDTLRKSLEWVFQTGQPSKYEARFLIPGVGTCWYETGVGPIKRDGKVTAATLITTDITARKKAEQALQASESRYRDLVEEMSDVIYTLDTEGNVTSVNKAGKTTFGREPDEVIGKSYTTWIAQEDLPNAEAAFKRILNGEKITTETVVLDKEGKPHNVQFSSTPILQDGKIVGTRGIIRDITERKRAEHEIAESEEKYRQLVSTTTDAIELLDGETREYVDVNKACEELYGYSREEFLNLRLSDITAEPEKSENSVRQALKGTLGRIPLRYHKKKDGTVFPVEISVSVFQLRGRRLLCGVVRDITERKKAQEALHQSEIRYRRLMDNISDGVYIVNREGYFTFVNEVILNRSEIPLETFKRLHFLDIVCAEDHERVQDNFARVLQGQGVRPFELRYKTASGMQLVVETNLKPIYQGETIVAIQGTSRDITERKKAQEMLQQSEETFRAFFDAIPDTAVLMDARTTILAINRAGADRLGRSVGEIVGKNAKDILPADVFELRRSRVAEVVRTGKMVRYEDERAGLYFDTCICPVFDAQGTVERLATFARDITLEKRLEKKTVELAKFPDENPNPVLRISEDCAVLYANGASSAILETWGTQVAHNFPEAWCKRVKEALSSGEVSTFEFNCDDGRIFLITLAPVVEEGYLNAYGLDITGRKSAEEALRESELRYRSLFESVPVGIGLATMDGKVLDCNNTMLQMTGYSKAGIRGKNVKDAYVSPKQRALLLEKLQMEGFVADFEAQLKREDGTTYWANLTITPFPSRTRNTILTVASDITRRKKAEEVLEIKDKAIASSINGIAIADPQGNLTYVNDSFLEMWGYDDARQVPGKHAIKFWRDENRAKKVIEVLHKTGSWIGELTAVRQDNSTFDVQISASAVKDEKGNIVCMMASFVDVTERRKAEDALRKSEQEFKDMFENTAVGMYRTTPDGRILMANPALVRMLGYSSFDELSQRNLEEEGFEPSYQRSVFKERLERQGQIVGLESQWMRRDGTSLVVIENVRVVRDESGRILYYEGTAEDITERKKAAEKIRQLNSAVGRSIDGVAMGVVEPGESTPVLTYVNESFARMHGYSSEEMLGMPVKDLHNKEQIPKFRKSIKHIIEQGRWQGEIGHVRKDGISFPTEMSVASFKNEEGIPAIIAVCRDITERRRAEERLHEAQAKYRALVEQVPAITYTAMLDEASTTMYISPQVEQMLGISPHDYKEAPDFWRKQLHPEDRQHVLARVAECHETGQPFICEYRMITKDGRTIWVSDHARIVQDSGRNPLCLQGIMLDVTERREAEAALRSQEELLRNIVSNVAHSIFWKDRNSVYLGCNDNFAKAAGIENPADIIGKTDYDLPWKKQESDSYRKIDQDVMAKGSPILNVEESVHDARGKSAIVLTSKVPLKNVDGEIIGILGIYTDITELKQAQERLSMYREKMAQAERLASLGTLGATLAHELTQPLTVVRLSIENSLADLETTSCPASVTEGLKDSLVEISHTVSIIDRLRSFARKSSKEEVSKVDLKAVAERVTQLLDGHSQRTGITVRLKNMDKLPSVFANEKDLEQLFFALVENAIHAADGKKGRQLTISAAIEGQHVELRFSDNCGGIAPENLDKIFEPFFTTKAIGEGTGLGLCIVQRIVFHAGGKIRVESKTGKGSTFIVTLPINRGQRS